MRALPVLAALGAACAGVPREAPTTAFPEQPVFARCVGRNVVFYNHADPSIVGAAVVTLLQAQYEFLRDFMGTAPVWIVCHAGAGYDCGHARGDGPHPEMFLQAGSIFDTQANYAHEMTHCFHTAFGRLPHWFDESLADAMYFESEVALYGRRHETEFLRLFDRVDHRSYELMQLRARYGAGFFRRVYRELRARQEQCRATMAGGALEDKNRLLLDVLSAAAGEDLLPRFQREFGFNPRTRERQRGY